jgi:hypothetical protein
MHPHIKTLLDNPLLGTNKGERRKIEEMNQSGL